MRTTQHVINDAYTAPIRKRAICRSLQSEPRPREHGLKESGVSFSSKCVSKYRIPPMAPLQILTQILRPNPTQSVRTPPSRARIKGVWRVFQLQMCIQISNTSYGSFADTDAFQQRQFSGHLDRWALPIFLVETYCTWR